MNDYQPSIEVSNMITQPGEVWYRDGLVTGFGFYDAVIAPHELTERLSIVVPADKVWRINYIAVRIGRATAAGTLDYSYVVGKLNASQCLQVMFRNNTVGADVYRGLALSWFLDESDDLSFETGDDSTTGTVQYTISVLYNQYDV